MIFFFLTFLDDEHKSDSGFYPKETESSSNNQSKGKLSLCTRNDQNGCIPFENKTGLFVARMLIEHA